MELSVTLINLAGAVALLLWGVHMVQTGVQRAFGARLRGFLGNALRNRFKAFLAGVGVTALLQSSTATGLMITGFAAGGLVELVPALAVMLGANVGTTLIVQILSFDVAEIAPALILIGLLMFRRASAGPRDFGRVLIGLGLMLMALHNFIALLKPYEDVPSLRLLLGAIATQPLLDVIVAAGVTWAAHSSVAVVLVIMSFAAQGTVPPEAAFALVLGANLGTAINPLLEGTTGTDPAARRLPVGNLVNRIFGVGCCVAALPYIGPWLVAIDPNNARAVADFHTAFNVILALVFFPLLTPYAGLLKRWMPPAQIKATRASHCTSTRVRARRRFSRSARRRARRCGWRTCWRACWSACGTHSTSRTADRSERPNASTTCSTSSIPRSRPTSRRSIPTGWAKATSAGRAKS